MKFSDEIDETPAPIPMNNINIFEDNYSIEQEILNTEEYKIYIGKEKKTKDKKKVIIKEYNEKFIKKLQNFSLFYLEKKYLKDCKNKYIIKLDKINNKDNFYQSENKLIFVFEYFETTLRNEVRQKG